MMTEQEMGIELDGFRILLEGLYGGMGLNDPLQRIRAKAWERFTELGLPTRSHDVYRYLRLRSLYSQSYASAKKSEIAFESISPYILPECQQSVLVFVNGFFVSELSRTEQLPKRAVVSSLSGAMRTYSTFLNSRWTSALKEETDPFVALNGALQSEALFFYLPPKTVVDAPIQLLNIIDAKDAPMLVLPRLQAFIGSQSQANFVSTQAVVSGRGYGVNMVVDLAIEEGARVQHTQISTQLADDTWDLTAIRGVLKRDSFFKTVAVTTGAATVRQDYRVTMTGENAEVSLNGLWMLDEKREAHTHVLIEHQAPHCRSMQLFKGVLNGLSRSAFEGKILVRQAAQKTEAFQLNHNLLLSDLAHADSKPNLEIFADDVKASHGATMGQLDKEQLFYMSARGFNLETAKKLLVHGFCEEVLAQIPLDSLKRELKIG